MSSISSSNSPSSYLNPCAQIQQFCNSLCSIVGTVCESAHSAFGHVQVIKYDEQGNIKFYNKKEKVLDPDTGQTKFVTKKESIRTYIEDLKTGKLYMDEEWYVVSMKCAAIALGMPFFTIGVMSWQLAKTPIQVAIIAIKTITEVGKLFCSGQCHEALKECGRGAAQVAETVGTGLYEIVKAPLFGLGCELAAIYGVFKPFHGRKIESDIEYAWQHGASFKEDFRLIPARPDEDCLTAFVKDIQSDHPFFLAHCFQARGNVNDRCFAVVGRSPL